MAQTLKTHKAFGAFQRGDYRVAKALYMDLAKQIGIEFFQANIDLCERRLKENPQEAEKLKGTKHTSNSNFESEIKLQENTPLMLEKRGLYNANRSKDNEGTVRIDPQSLTLTGKCTREVALIDVPVLGATLELNALVTYHLKSEQTTRHAAVLMDFLDSDGKRVGEIPGLGMASAFKRHFTYLNDNVKSGTAAMQPVLTLELPKKVVSIRIAVGSLAKPDETVEIRISGRCYSKDAERGEKHRRMQDQPLPGPIVHDPIDDKSGKRRISSLVVACILDEFTTECLSHEVNLLPLSPDTWLQELDENRPDFLLIESCWRGNDNLWGALTKGSGGLKKISAVLKHCSQKGIPAVFWNKEDPPHYEKFSPLCPSFDLVITTDQNMVPQYKRDFGVDAVALSFAAQPRVHNPTPVVPRLARAVFAGSYYGDKPKRCSDFDKLMGQIEHAGLEYDIYDRNHDRNIDKFAFPSKYRKNILGNLPPSEVWRAHKGYKYQINLNSVQDSPTMFARRVYESLASGTPVISNFSVGVEQTFGDLVLMQERQSTVAEQIRELETSARKYHELSRRGVRAVMRDHTYGHRIKTICQLLGIDVALEIAQGTAVMVASSLHDLNRARDVFSRQTALNKHLFIELENFEGSHELLNHTDSFTTYVLRGARDLYSSEASYFGNRKNVLRLNLDSKTTELEDFVYWGCRNHE